MTATIGMIGLGIMGGAMARNLRLAGFDVVGFDIDASATAAATQAGIEIAASATAVAERASDILVSLPNAAAVIETARVIAAGSAKARTVIETSTLALADKTAFGDILAEAGHVALDCPLSGTGAQAKAKDLVVFASGDASAVTRLEPVFQGFARKTYNLGPYGNGSKMKYVANLLVAIHNVATAEALVLAERAGLDGAQVLDVVASGAGNSRVFELRGPMMVAKAFQPATMRARTWQKDMAVIRDFASELNCPTPLFGSTTSIYDAAIAMGHGDDDVAAVISVLQSMGR